jgi:Acetyltransferase (GNAT) domain
LAGPRGYALYAADNLREDDDSLPDCTLTIPELIAADPAAGAALWTSAAPDVSLGMRELGAAYLGGIRLGALAGAGLVSEHRPGVLNRLSTAMSWDPSP